MLKKISSKIKSFISRKSILPASLFSKRQLQIIEDNFKKFWDPSHSFENLSRPKTFSTFTLGCPINLWTYYFHDKKSRGRLLADYQVEPFEVQSYDQTVLHGTIFKKRKRFSGPSRVFLVFGGNGELHKIGSCGWVFQLLEHVPCDFDIVLFDPRGCGRNEGVPTAAALIRDGKAVLDASVKELNTPIDLVDLCGFSLGGAIATHVKSLYPNSQGILINNRSFQSLDKAIHGIFHPLGPSFAKWFGRLAASCAEDSHWKLNPLHAWTTIKAPKMVICHPKDPVIHHSASLERGLHDKDLLETCVHIQLSQKNPLELIKNHHVEPLSSYNDQSGEDALGLILEFLSSHVQKKEQNC